MLRKIFQQVDIRPIFKGPERDLLQRLDLLCANNHLLLPDRQRNPAFGWPRSRRLLQQVVPETAAFACLTPASLRTYADNDPRGDSLISNSGHVAKERRRTFYPNAAEMTDLHARNCSSCYHDSQSCSASHPGSKAPPGSRYEQSTNEHAIATGIDRMLGPNGSSEQQKTR